MHPRHTCITLDYVLGNTGVPRVIQVFSGQIYQAEFQDLQSLVGYFRSKGISVKSDITLYSTDSSNRGLVSKKAIKSDNHHGVKLSTALTTAGHWFYIVLKHGSFASTNSANEISL